MVTRSSAIRLERGLILDHTPLTSRGVSTAGLNSALAVKVRLRPVWNPSSTGDPVMVRVGGGTRGEGGVGLVTVSVVVVTHFAQ